MKSRNRVRWLLFLPFALMLVISSASGAQADGPLTYIGHVPLNAKAHGLALQNNLAYVATEKGLTILNNIANPGPPLSIGTVGVLQPKLPAFPSTLLKSQAVAVEGDYAYLVGAYLIVVDISEPALPEPVGKLAIPGGGMDVVVKDNVIYAISFAGELYVICAAAPRPAGCPAGASAAAPKIARVIGLPAWANAGADLVNLKRLCPPDGTPPCDQPAMTSGNGRGTGVSLAGDRLFAVEWAYGRLYHFEITNPLHPKFVSTHYAQYLIKAYADLDQDVVYMLTAFGSVSGLRSVPISVLDDFVSSRYNACPGPPYPPCGYLKSDFAIDMGDLAIAGNKYVVYAGGKGAGEFHIVDTVPTLQNEATDPDGIGLHGVAMANGMAVRTQGDFVFQAAGVLGLQVHMFTNLSQ